VAGEVMVKTSESFTFPCGDHLTKF